MNRVTELVLIVTAVALFFAVFRPAPVERDQIVSEDSLDFIGARFAEMAEAQTLPEDWESLFEANQLRRRQQFSKSFRCDSPYTIEGLRPGMTSSEVISRYGGGELLRGDWGCHRRFALPYSHLSLVHAVGPGDPLVRVSGDALSRNGRLVASRKTPPAALKELLGEPDHRDSHQFNGPVGCAPNAVHSWVYDHGDLKLNVLLVDSFVQSYSLYWAEAVELDSVASTDYGR